MREPIYWTTREGKRILVDDMTESHAKNTLKMILRNLNNIVVKEALGKKKVEFKLNGDMANQFIESYYEDEDDDLHDETYLHFLTFNTFLP
jgi:hypothetical protein